MSLANVLLVLSQEITETVVQTETQGNETLATAAVVAALAAVVASQAKKVSKFKLLMQSAKAKWKSLFAKKKVDSLTYLMSGGLLCVLGFVVLFGALFGSGAVGGIILGCLLLLGAGVLIKLGADAY